MKTCSSEILDSICSFLFISFLISAIKQQVSLVNKAKLTVYIFVVYCRLLNASMVSFKYCRYMQRKQKKRMVDSTHGFVYVLLFTFSQCCCRRFRGCNTGLRHSSKQFRIVVPVEEDYFNYCHNDGKDCN